MGLDEGARGDRTEAVLSGLRARITPQQHELLRRLWEGGDHLGWVTAKSLFHKLPTSSSRRALENLRGSLVTEATGGMEESYVIRLLGALVGERGVEFEDLLSRFLAYEVKRYDDDMNVKDITKAEVERDLHLSESALSDLYRLVTIAVPTLCNGSSGGSSWSLGVLKNIHDLTEVTDWPRFVREHALRNYDPAVPVRAAGRDEYLARKREDEVVTADIPAFWLPGHFRVFISHVSGHKTEASGLKVALQRFHFSGFVAHADIEPTKEWQNEIMAALQSADVLVALVTPEFHASKWTDQEVGFVLGREKLVVSVGLDGTPPYGFLGRDQAINGNGKSPEQLAASLFRVLARHESTRKRVSEAVVAGFERSATIQAGEENSAMLGDLEYMGVELAARVRAASVSNQNISLFSENQRRVEDALARWNL